MKEFNSNMMNDDSAKNYGIYEIINKLISKRHISIYKLNLYCLKYRYKDDNDEGYKINISNCLDYDIYRKVYKILYKI